MAEAAGLANTTDLGAAKAAARAGSRDSILLAKVQQIYK
jgi:hypothetical protein